METKHKPAKRAAAKTTVFSDEEQAAMRELVQERKRARSGKIDGESDVLAKIAEMTEPDHTMATRIHAIVKAGAPQLSPKTWYGMPAYAKGGDVVCFFQSGQKFKARYATLGFSDKAQLDDGAMWANSYAVQELTPAVEARIAELVRKAAG